MDFPKQPWLDGFRAAGLELRRHRLRVLHASAHRPLRLEHGAAQRPLGADLPEGEIHLPQGRIRGMGGGDRSAAISRPATSGATIASRSSRPARRCWSTTTIQLDDTVWLTPTPGHSPYHCCVEHPLARPARGGDRRHDAPRAAVPRAGLVDHLRLGRDKEAAASRRRFLSEVADTSTLVLPIHFPIPTVGRVDGGRRAVPLLVRALARRAFDDTVLERYPLSLRGAQRRSNLGQVARAQPRLRLLRRFHLLCNYR